MRPETWQKWHGPAAGSTMFLSPNEQVSVENLLKGIVTLSGNDASVVLAECIAGTEQAFAQQMNTLAHQIGVTNSRFCNANGWPDNGCTYVTARDLATLARAEIDYKARVVVAVKANRCPAPRYDCTAGRGWSAARSVTGGACWSRYSQAAASREAASESR